jgi:hypothetical protein
MHASGTFGYLRLLPTLLQFCHSAGGHRLPEQLQLAFCALPGWAWVGQGFLGVSGTAGILPGNTTPLLLHVRLLRGLTHSGVALRQGPCHESVVCASGTIQEGWGAMRHITGLPAADHNLCWPGVRRQGDLTDSAW